MTQTFNGEIPYEVDVLVTTGGVLHDVNASVYIVFEAERWDKNEPWDIEYRIRIEKLKMRNLETDEDITLVEDAETSVKEFIYDYIRNGAGGLNNIDVIQKCGEAISEEETFGYEEEH